MREEALSYRLMRRWHRELKTEVENPTIDSFLTELATVCKKHCLHIATEAYDALEVWPLYDGDDLRELLNANDATPMRGCGK